jgi:large subunit ribosomal protein L4
MKGAPAGEFELAESLMERERGEQALHDVVVAQLAQRRSGTASTLQKGEVAGSNRKLWKQKGTGRARTGLRRSPIWRGGGVVFGPKPRDYSQKVNRKVARLALRRAFADRVAGDGLKVVESLELAEGKTRALVAALKALGVSAPALLLVDAVERNLSLAARNLPRVEAVTGREVSVLQLTRYPRVVASRAGLKQLLERLAAGGGEGAA